MQKTLETKKDSHLAPVILRVQQVKSRTGLGRSSLYAKLNPKSPYYDSTFPHPIRISARAVGWLESEISAWITMRISSGRN